MEKKRARRRRDKERMKAKAVRIYSRYALSNSKESTEDRAFRDRKYADHLAVCSCEGCGNPRKWWGEKTMQELTQVYQAGD